MIIVHGGIFYIVCGATKDAPGFIEKPTIFLIGIVPIVVSITGFGEIGKKWVNEPGAL